MSQLARFRKTLQTPMTGAAVPTVGRVWGALALSFAGVAIMCGSFFVGSFQVSTLCFAMVVEGIGFTMLLPRY